MDKLRALYLVESIPAWSRSRTQRAVRKPKVIGADSGLAAEVAGLDEDLLLSQTGAVHLGGALEGFVAVELIRQQTWSRTAFAISHFRESGGAEVDLSAWARASGRCPCLRSGRCSPSLRPT